MLIDKRERKEKQTEIDDRLGAEGPICEEDLNARDDEPRQLIVGGDNNDDHDVSNGGDGGDVDENDDGLSAATHTPSSSRDSPTDFLFDGETTSTENIEEDTKILLKKRLVEWQEKVEGKMIEIRSTEQRYKLDTKMDENIKSLDFEGKGDGHSSESTNSDPADESDFQILNADVEPRRERIGQETAIPGQLESVDIGYSSTDHNEIHEQQKQASKDHNVPKSPDRITTKDARTKFQKLQVITSPSTESKLQTPAETQYNSPRSSQRKAKLVEWKREKIERMSSTERTGTKTGARARTRSRKDQIINNHIHNHIRKQETKTKRDPSTSRRNQSLLINTNSRLLHHTAISAARDMSLSPKGREKSDSAVSLNMNKYKHVKSKLHSPTAASRARSISASRRKNKQAYVHVDSPRSYNSNSKFNSNSTVRRDTERLKLRVKASPLPEKIRKEAMRVTGQQRSLRPKTPDRPMVGKKKKMLSPLPPDSNQSVQEAVAVSEDSFTDTKHFDFEGAASSSASEENTNNSHHGMTETEVVDHLPVPVPDPPCLESSHSSSSEGTNGDGTTTSVSSSATDTSTKSSNTSLSSSSFTSTSIQSSTSTSTIASTNTSTSVASTLMPNDSNPTEHQPSKRQDQLRKSHFSSNVQILATDVSSSEDSEDDILLNTYQYDNKRLCASNEVLSKVIDNKSELSRDDIEGGNSSCTSSKSLPKDLDPSQNNNEEEYIKPANLQESIDDIITDDTTTLCSFDKLWDNFTKGNKCIALSKAGCFSKKRTCTENSAESDDGRAVTPIQMDVASSLSVEVDIKNALSTDDGQKLRRRISTTTTAAFSKNFLEEWPKDASQKNIVAKEMIEDAYKNSDLESMAKLCHKFREEFSAARFYIGVLMMEKDDLLNKLSSITDTFQDHIDDHDIIMAENYRLKEQILELHGLLDENDMSTQENMMALEREMSETLQYALDKAKGLQRELEMSRLKKKMLEVELSRVKNLR